MISTRSFIGVMVWGWLVGGTACADLILAYESADTGSNPLEASFSGPDITAVDLSRIGVSAAPGPLFSSRGWTDGGELEFGYVAVGDATVDLERLEIAYSRSVTGPTRLRIEIFNSDTFPEVIYEDLSVDTSAEVVTNIDLTSYKDFGNAAFVVYGLNASDATGTLTLENSGLIAGGASIALYATASGGGGAAVPEPATFGATGLLSLTMILIRRRIQRTARSASVVAGG